MSGKYYWVSWYQPTEDYRPLTYPPNEKILGYWCTGHRCADDASTLVALVKAESEPSVKLAITEDWPEAEEYRFCDETFDLAVGDRFPVKDWMRARGVNEVNP